MLAPPSKYGKWILQGPKHLEIEEQPPPADRVRLRLFCFPQSGMGGWAFHGWTQWLPPEVECMPVELPGRNSRIREPKPDNATALAADTIEALLPLLREKPYAVFGHSMGAWLLFEVLHELRRQGEPLPVKAYFSAMRAPHLCGAEHDADQVAPVLHDLSDELFWQHFERRYGKNPDLASKPIQAFVLPLLRADFKMSETYELPVDVLSASEFLKLPFPIAALGANGDSRYTADQLAEWAKHTSLTFSQHWFEGKGSIDPSYWGTPHRYATDYPEPLVRFLCKDLLEILNDPPKAQSG
mmetsp:Transcript_2072/g.4700  ORF Transcript_2072/g.4700 Transcript_2072/m.4700 type:complete len:298 (+) Transcript_2072:52-945(+)